MIKLIHMESCGTFSGAACNCGAEVHADPHASKWIKHTGNKCPVDKDAAVKVRLANSCETCGFASDFDWNVLDGCDGSITHYRPAIEEQEDLHASKWIKHTGNEYPVDNGVMVDVKFADGSVTKGITKFLHWSLIDNDKITHYRLTSDEQEDQIAQSAVSYLRKGAQHIEDRASQRDCPDGERSMAKTVEAFNTIYGHNLSETDGWQFMSILKKVRAVQGGYHEDDYEDDIGYAALAAECEALSQKKNTTMGNSK